MLFWQRSYLWNLFGIFSIYKNGKENADFDRHLDGVGGGIQRKRAALLAQSMRLYVGELMQTMTMKRGPKETCCFACPVNCACVLES